MATGTTVDTIVSLLDSNPRAVLRGIQVLFAKQTEDEKSHETTRHTNRRGFNYPDAKFGCIIAKRLATCSDLSKAPITPNEFARAKRMLKKYRWQLLIAAAEKAIAHRPELVALWNQVMMREINFEEAYVLDDALQEFGFPDGVNVCKHHRVPLKRHGAKS